jgi:diacylglycerol O-acyltransferase / wax synthase
MKSAQALRKLGSTDAFLLRLESPDTHMHTGSLLTLKLPHSAPADYMQQLFQLVCSLPHTESPPFCYRLHRGRRWRSPAWERVQSIKLDYHVRRESLPAPGGDSELATLVGRIHSQALDLSRPLWRCYLIEGLAADRFAIYLKMHHALADGGTVVRMISSLLSESPGPFSLDEALARRYAEARAPLPGSGAPTVGKLQVLSQVSRAFAHSARSAWRRDDPELAVPYGGPPSMFGRPIGPDRSYAIQSLSLATLRELGKKTGSTINDLVLVICAGALRSYMLRQDSLPSRAMVTSVPVALQREQENALEGNEVSGVLMALPTHLADVRERLAFTRSAMRKAKEQVLAMPKAAILLYTNLQLLPFMSTQVMGVGARIPPLSNLVISNVPGPRKALYYHGAAVEHMYPASVIFPGQALNITVRGYGDTLNFGIVACPNAVPALHTLAGDVSQAALELGEAFGCAAPQD